MDINQKLLGDVVSASKAEGEAEADELAAAIEKTGVEDKKEDA